MVKGARERLQARAERRAGDVASREPADCHNLLYHGLLVTAYEVSFWLYHYPELIGIERPLGLAAFVLGCGIMLGWTSGVNVAVNFHNRAHLPIFRSAAANRWLSRFWAVTAG